jgi:hypothetical protein
VTENTCVRVVLSLLQLCEVMRDELKRQQAEFARVLF